MSDTKDQFHVLKCSSRFIDQAYAEESSQLKVSTKSAQGKGQWNSRWIRPGPFVGT